LEETMFSFGRYTFVLFLSILTPGAALAQMSECPFPYNQAQVSCEAIPGSGDVCVVDSFVWECDTAFGDEDDSITAVHGTPDLALAWGHVMEAGKANPFCCQVENPEMNHIVVDTEGGRDVIRLFHVDPYEWDGTSELFAGDGRDLVVGSNFSAGTYFGTGAADYIDLGNGEPGLQFALAGGGDDHVEAPAADTHANYVSGGHGQDTIWGGGGVDFLSGGDGEDEIHGEAGDDRILGGPETGDPADLLYGGGGDDRISGDRGDDELQGGPGDDALWGEDGEDRLFGGSGDDDIHGGGDDDLVRGGPDDDRLCGGFGADKVFGGWGDFDVCYDHPDARFSCEAPTWSWDSLADGACPWMHASP